MDVSLRLDIGQIRRTAWRNEKQQGEMDEGLFCSVDCLDVAVSKVRVVVRG